MRGPGGSSPNPPPTLLCVPPTQGWLLSLLDDNTLHLWEICQKDGCSHLEETRSFGLPGRPGSDSNKYLPGGVPSCLLLMGLQRE